MQVIEMPISEIKPYEKNPRRNDDSVDKCAESIKEYGWKQPLVVDADNVIVVGHTRYKAALKLGCETVPVVIADDLPPEKVKAYRLADNKVGEYSVWDNKLLLDELSEIDMGLFTGFDIGEVFDDILDEGDNTPIEENESGVIWELVVKSSSREKVERMAELWKEVNNELA